MTALAGRIVSLQVGLPRRLTTEKGRLWESAIVKESVEGRVPLGAENLAGDYQANRKYHGGPDKAVCAYSAEHYPDWRHALGLDLPLGAFGENVTVQNLTEDMVCVGDVFTVGPALLQVSQPRQPCASLSKRWSRPQLPRLVEQSGRTGFYTRVLQPGDLAAGDELVLAQRPHENWTLARANALMYDANADPQEIAALCALAALSAEWKRILSRKLARR